MALPAEASANALNVAEGCMGQIPVRNLWLLMLYASDLFRTQGTGAIGLEDSPDELPDLVAEILAHAVEQRQRRQLSRSYVALKSILSRVRGRIDVLKTERHQLLARGLVACRFDDLRSTRLAIALSAPRSNRSVELSADVTSLTVVELWQRV